MNGAPFGRRFIWALVGSLERSAGVDTVGVTFPPIPTTPVIDCGFWCSRSVYELGPDSVVVVPGVDAAAVRNSRDLIEFPTRSVDLGKIHWNAPSFELSRPLRFDCSESFVSRSRFA